MRKSILVAALLSSNAMFANVYSDSHFTVNTGAVDVFTATQNPSNNPVTVLHDGKTVKYTLFNSACRDDIYDDQGKRYTACSAMLLSQSTGRQMAVIGYCNPHATSDGKQYNNKVMYMPVGGSQNCLSTPGKGSKATSPFSCPCYLPDS